MRVDVGVDFTALACQFFIQFVGDFHVNCTTQGGQLEANIGKLRCRISRKIVM